MIPVCKFSNNNIDPTSFFSNEVSIDETITITPTTDKTIVTRNNDQLIDSHI